METCPFGVGEVTWIMSACAATEEAADDEEEDELPPVPPVGAQAARLMAVPMRSAFVRVEVFIRPMIGLEASAVKEKASKKA